MSGKPGGVGPEASKWAGKIGDRIRGLNEMLKDTDRAIMHIAYGQVGAQQIPFEGNCILCPYWQLEAGDVSSIMLRFEPEEEQVGLVLPSGTGPAFQFSIHEKCAIVLPWSRLLVTPVGFGVDGSVADLWFGTVPLW